MSCAMEPNSGGSFASEATPDALPPLRNRIVPSGKSVPTSAALITGADLSLDATRANSGIGSTSNPRQPPNFSRKYVLLCR